MTTTIDWGTSVISVPRADLTLLQSSPTEIRQLDLNAFRLDLKSLEDSSDGMAFLRTHNHNTSVTVGGVVLARVVEIINGYTLTFEDGQYAVNLVGANSNAGDVVNVNQVSVRSANSAGLQDLSTLLVAAYNGVVVIDVVYGQSGTSTPIGTESTPVDNFADAIIIAVANGIKRIKLRESATLAITDFSRGYIFESDNPVHVTLTIASAANVEQCIFRHLTIQGVLDGNNVFESCDLLDLDYVNGSIFRCALGGTITLGGGANASIIDSWNAFVDQQSAILDMGGSGQSVAIRKWNGQISIINKTGSDSCIIEMDAGVATLTSTVSSGNIVVRGVGRLINNSTGTAVIVEELLDPKNLNHSLFIGGQVYLNTASSFTGALFPVGTINAPVNNLTDAILIASQEGISTINLTGTIVAYPGTSLDGLRLVGSGQVSNVLILAGATTVNSSFYLLIIVGAFTGIVFTDRCILGYAAAGQGITGFEGLAIDCIFGHEDGVVLASSGTIGTIRSSIFAVDDDSQVVLDMNGSSCNLDGASGTILLKNYTGGFSSTQSLHACSIEIDSSCTKGTLTLMGDAEVTENSNGTVVIDNTSSKKKTQILSKIEEMNLI